MQPNLAYAIYDSGFHSPLGYHWVRFASELDEVQLEAIYYRIVAPEIRGSDHDYPPKLFKACVAPISANLCCWLQLFDAGTDEYGRPGRYVMAVALSHISEFSPANVLSVFETPFFHAVAAIAQSRGRDFSTVPFDARFPLSIDQQQEHSDELGISPNVHSKLPRLWLFKPHEQSILFLKSSPRVWEVVIRYAVDDLPPASLDQYAVLEPGSAASSSEMKMKSTSQAATRSMKPALPLLLLFLVLFTLLTILLLWAFYERNMIKEYLKGVRTIIGRRDG